MSTNGRLATPPYAGASDGPLSTRYGSPSASSRRATRAISDARNRTRTDCARTSSCNAAVTPPGAAGAWSRRCTYSRGTSRW